MGRQLSALDAQFLNFETATNVAHIAGLAILDPSTAPGGVITREDLISLLQERLHLAPPLRRHLVQVPLRLDHPYWAEDREVDFDYHVREIALPPPGDDHQLGEQVARLHSRRLDRRRPLWELYLIHGLSGGRVAIYTKVHHSAVDGVSGAELLGALVDLSPERRSVLPPEDGPESAPEPVDMIVQAVARVLANPGAGVRFLASAMPRLDEIPVVSQIPGAGLVSRLLRSAGTELPHLPRMTVPKTPFSGRISPHRRFAFGTLPLDDVKRVKNAFGVTVNDVIMALCAGALRRWLAKRDELPQEPLVAGIPISARGETKNDAMGNEVVLAMATIPTSEADPEARLASVSKSMRMVKERFAAAPASWLLELSQAMPAALSGLADRAAFRLAAGTAPATNLMISNVPGPQLPLYICGARMLAHHPVSVITDVTGGINITVFSYDGSLDFGIVVDRDMVPDVWDLVDYLRDALDELTAVSSAGRS
jgi:WS/DGAT/MGAT family acyltransferase